MYFSKLHKSTFITMSNVWQSRQATATPQELPAKDEKLWPSASDAVDREREDKEKVDKPAKEPKSQSSTPTDSTSTRRGA